MSESMQKLGFAWKQISSWNEQNIAWYYPLETYKMLSGIAPLKRTKCCLVLPP